MPSFVRLVHVPVSRSGAGRGGARTSLIIDHKDHLVLCRDWGHGARVSGCHTDPKAFGQFDIQYSPCYYYAMYWTASLANTVTEPDTTDGTCLTQRQACTAARPLGASLPLSTYQVLVHLATMLATDVPFGGARWSSTYNGPRSYSQCRKKCRVGAFLSGKCAVKKLSCKYNPYGSAGVAGIAPGVHWKIPTTSAKHSGN